MKTSNKIISNDQIESFILKARNEGKSIAFTNGCFDLLHLGHLDYLEKASEEGDLFIVGLNSDQSVKRLKGESRPINDNKSRSHMLAAMQFIDAVMFFEDDTPINLITKVQPDVLIKGGDYLTENIVGADFVKEHGGRVMTIPFLDGYSSTSIIDKIKNS